MSEEISATQIDREIMSLAKKSANNEITLAEVSAWQYLKKLRERHMWRVRPKKLWRAKRR